MQATGRVSGIWRYPISSVGGEAVTTAELTPSGILDDRNYALVDAVTGSPAAPESELRWRKALHLTASIQGGLPLIAFPEGDRLSILDKSVNELLSEYFGFRVAIARLSGSAGSDGLPHVSHRHVHHPVHILAEASLLHLAALRGITSVDVRRFRPNILISTGHAPAFVETSWISHEMTVGKTVLAVAEESKRCGVVLASQPDLREDPDILRALLRYNRRNFGAYCSVKRAGPIENGDMVALHAVSHV